jgi:hypothetical protein
MNWFSFIKEVPKVGGFLYAINLNYEYALAHMEKIPEAAMSPYCFLFITLAVLSLGILLLHKQRISSQNK